MEPHEEKTILVVDNDAQIRSGLEAGLELRGYRVATARNGREGLAWLDGHRPHLIVLDVVMPEIDGQRFISELRRRGLHPGVLIIIVSGNHDARDGVAELDAAAFFPKPLHLAQFLQEVERLAGD